MGNYLSLMFMVLAATMAVPIAVCLFYPSEMKLAPAFLLPALLLTAIGIWLKVINKHKELSPLDFKESSLVVTLTWVAMSLAGSIPFILISGMNFTHAVFDSVSGWTTTGLSVLDVTKAPRVLLFFRAWTQFIGGAGFAIIMLASLTGVGAQHIYSAEGKGTLIKPNVLASARIVVKLYLGYMVVGILAYLLLGLKLLDAIVYCFCAISTGGFANHVQSIGYYDSAAVEFVTIVLMVLGNLSFLIGYFLVKGKLRSVARNGEVKVLTVGLLISIPVLFLATTSMLYGLSSKALRVAVFEAVSAITTTGFSSVSYIDPRWSEAGILVLIILQLVGGGTCSTAGGMKQYRIYMMYKTILWHIKSSLLPGKAVTRNYIWEGDQKGYVNDARIRSISSFVYAYMTIYALGVMAISMSVNPVTRMPYSIMEAMFEFSSALGTVGLSIGVTSLTAPLHVIWIETLGMLLGRLEIFVVIISIAKICQDSGRGIAGLTRSKQA